MWGKQATFLDLLMISSELNSFPIQEPLLISTIWYCDFWQKEKFLHSYQYFCFLSLTLKRLFSFEAQISLNQTLRVLWKLNSDFFGLYFSIMIYFQICFCHHFSNSILKHSIPFCQTNSRFLLLWNHQG